MNILALDLGTKTGWAVGREAGTWPLMKPKEVTEQGKLRGDRRLDLRVVRLWGKLADVHKRTPLAYIVFEDVRFGSTTMQAHLWASFRTVVWLFAFLHGIKTECLDTSKLKQYATGHGGATKEMMAAWLVKRMPERYRLGKDGVVGVDIQTELDDNGVDAAHLLRWAEAVLIK